MRSHRFEAAVLKVLKHEGGYVDHPADPGQATKYGISLRFLNSAKIDINGDGEISAEDIAGLTIEQAKDIYYTQWWTRYGYEGLNDLAIASKVLDTAIWIGPAAAHRILQIAVNRLNHVAIVVDGRLGPVTLKGVNKLVDIGEGASLLKEIRDNLEHYIINLVADNPSFQAFKSGWLRRSIT